MSFKTGASKFLKDAKGYIDERLELFESYMQGNFPTKNELDQTVDKIQLEIKKINDISTQAFYVVADENGKAKKIICWNKQRKPFKELPTKCDLYQQSYNLTTNAYNFEKLIHASYERTSSSENYIAYIFTVTEDINAQDIDLCSIDIRWIYDVSQSAFTGIPKVIQATI